MGLLLLIVISGLFFLKSSLTPPSFGEFGSYRGASVQEIMAKKTVHLGVENCKSCHKKQWKRWRKKAHKVVVCETCHGAGGRHGIKQIEPRPDPLRTKAYLRRNAGELCLSCHLASPGTTGKITTVRVEKHLAQFKILPGTKKYDKSKQCVNCHKGHKPKAK
jgi:hypothetical protein